ncbi:hypothetical protein N7495_002429 [Penicillium taxi]|uniref:uncharacterized protein n=1 Tax=Penicillium taxi TaxID=168475 RepID=UPI0025451621|nr:uncharacterized protein N7495_002429 [Penicillium taxi]KAJ5901901.1 hypothetical protein N7495_002429 [Penicillium taxi]
MLAATSADFNCRLAVILVSSGGTLAGLEGEHSSDRNPFGIIHPRSLVFRMYFNLDDFNAEGFDD